MTLTIEVSRDVGRALSEQARSKGQSMSEFVAALLTQAACSGSKPSSPDQTADMAARLAALARIGSYHTRTGLPPLPDDAVADVHREREIAKC